MPSIANTATQTRVRAHEEPVCFLGTGGIWGAARLRFTNVRLHQKSFRHSAGDFQTLNKIWVSLLLFRAIFASHHQKKQISTSVIQITPENALWKVTFWIDGMTATCGVVS